MRVLRDGKREMITGFGVARTQRAVKLGRQYDAGGNGCRLREQGDCEKQGRKHGSDIPKLA